MSITLKFTLFLFLGRVRELLIFLKKRVLLLHLR
jgi:hypothetical protein